MTRKADRPTVVLIGGTSHAGKSTLAHAMVARLGGQCISTDNLARHPGRPWRDDGSEVPAHVAEHYLSLTVTELLRDVLRHYRDVVRPLLFAAIDTQSVTSAILIVEGSAVLPEWIDMLHAYRVSAFWLAASKGAIEQRIHTSSRYEERSSRGQAMIDQFVRRACAFEEFVQAEVTQRGVASIDTEALSVSELVDQCVAKCLASRARLTH